MSDVIPLASGSGIPEPDAAQHFLGVRGADANEFVLLGLAPGTATRDNVINALRTQLTRVAQHPDAGTREAAQVRVMLHAAASRLLAPLMPAEQPAVVAPPVQPAALASAFERAAVRLLATHGGMNHASLKMIRQTAAAMGVSGDELQSVMVRLPLLVGQAANAPAPSENVIRVSRGEEDRIAAPLRQATSDDATKRLIVTAAVVIAGGLLLLGGVAYGVRIIFEKKPATPAGGAAVVGAGNAANAGNANDAATASPLSDSPSSDAKILGSQASTTDRDRKPVAAAKSPEELVTALREASVLARADATRGADAINTATAGLGAVWPTMPRDYLVAAGDSFLDAIYAVQRDETALQRVLDALVEQASCSRELFDDEPARVAQSIFARSLLARLQVERDLPASARRTLRIAAVAGLINESASRGPWAENLYDATAAVGRGLAAAASPPSRLPPEEAWKVFVSAARAATPEADRQEAQLLAALDNLMATGKEPTQDARVLMGIQTLASAIDWSGTGGGRGALVVWLARADVSSADLAVLTNVVAGKPEASADRTFALSPSASDQDRGELRDRFGSLWQTQSVGVRRDLALTWLEQATNVVQESTPTSVDDALRKSVQLAYLNASAARAWRGDAVIEARSIPVLPPATPNNNAAVFAMLHSRGNDKWGVDYLRAGPDLLRRRDALRAILGELSPLEAKLLVIDGMRGPTQDIRIEARRALTPAITSPVVTQAMLDFAPFMPPTREVSQLVAQATGRALPSPRNPAWRVEVRRALVWTLLRHVDDGRMTDITTAESYFATAYGMRMRVEPKAALPATEVIARVYDELTVDVQAVTRLRGSSAELTQLRARSRERLRAAVGDVQTYVVYETGIVELLALAVASEKPAMAAEIEKVMEQWRRDMALAGHVLQQIERSEHAQLQLWVIRMKESA
jgi:hypothetical protein